MWHGLPGSARAVVPRHGSTVGEYRTHYRKSTGLCGSGHGTSPPVVPWGGSTAPSAVVPYHGSTAPSAVVPRYGSTAV